jgi:ATP-dependent DNA helicase RecQ
MAGLVSMAGARLRRSTRGGLIIVDGINIGGSVEPIYNAVTLAEMAAEVGAAATSARPLQGVPMAMHEPDRLGILRDRFGFVEFRPGQGKVIDALLTHGGALAVFPTGAGKSLCYQLPALLFEGVTVVVSPLIALMKDQIDALRQRGIAAARLDSSLSADEVRAVGAGMREGTLKLLYVAPERFNNERFLEQLGGTRIALFAVDEAHCISEWGHNFRPDYLKLAATAREVGAERVLALTATATPAVIADICRSFEIPGAGVVVTGFHRPNLLLRTTGVTAASRDRVLLERLHARSAGPGIVYVTLQRTAEAVAARLAGAGFAARAYHAGMDDDERSAVQEWWKASDRALVVATIAFGMGIDKADVRYVYHYNLPKSLESYSQEIGRAGRDGLPAMVETLACLDDLPVLENFAYGDTPTESALRGLLDEILGGPAELDVNLLQLANRHDIRPLVLRTALTYLELQGVLRQGTPFYAGYKARLREPLERIAGRFAGERARLVRAIFEGSRFGRELYTLDPEALGATLGQDRQRIVRALDYLAEQGLVELQASDARQRFARLPSHPDRDALVAELSTRFERRERREVERLGQVVALITRAGCQTNALAAHFGEQRDEPCGHCSFCERGEPTRLPAPPARAAVEGTVEVRVLDALASAHPAALGEPRQQARFLCGLSSPALTRARLARHALYGALADHPFAAVLQWCGARQGTAPLG